MQASAAIFTPERIAELLAEDVGRGDATSNLMIPEDLRARATIRARKPLVMAGGAVAADVFHFLGQEILVSQEVMDGKSVEAGQVMLTIEGPARAVLTGERTALNLLQRGCSVATLTRAYVEAVKGTDAVILDTRKTMPGLRRLDKYAVRMGGGENHRMGLDDMIMLKDNHIALAGGIDEALARVANGNEKKLPVVIECDHLHQLGDILDFIANHSNCCITRVLLDNMSVETLHEAVNLTRGQLPLEASGNMTLDRVKAVADTGVNYISVGALTHSAPAVDIGLDVVFE